MAYSPWQGPGPGTAYLQTRIISRSNATGRLSNVSNSRIPQTSDLSLSGSKAILYTGLGGPVTVDRIGYLTDIHVQFTEIRCHTAPMGSKMIRCIFNAIDRHTPI